MVHPAGLRTVGTMCARNYGNMPVDLALYNYEKQSASERGTNVFPILKHTPVLKSAPLLDLQHVQLSETALAESHAH